MAERILAAENERVTLTSSARILVVDDDPKFRRFMLAGLQESGLACQAAASCREARATLAAGEPFHLILLDVMMPDESGWEFIAELRRAGDETPVIFLTARHSVDERIRGLQLGAEDYVIKPFAFSELLARIEVALRKQQRRSRITAGDLVLDLDRRAVERGGRLIEMSPREFDLLLALVRARGRVLTREHLLREVWGIDFDPGTNVVDVLVARLRKRIDAHGSSSIRTVVGEGYALAPRGDGAAAGGEARA
jgi:two-component system copper resistance phosphate regulon response regulator CusR